MKQKVLLLLLAIVCSANIFAQDASGIPLGI